MYNEQGFCYCVLISVGEKGKDFRPRAKKGFTFPFLLVVYTLRAKEKHEKRKKSEYRRRKVPSSKLHN